MTATFEIKINTPLRVANVGNLTGVVRKIDFVVKGTESGQSFELPQTVDLGDPDPASFTPLSSLSEAAVVGFVEAAFKNMEAVKSHIQFVLDKEVAKASLTEASLPWAPAPAEPTPTEPAPTEPTSPPAAPL